MVDNMRYRQYIFWIYLVFLVVASLIPLGAVNQSLTESQAVTIRLDYLLHFLIYLPLAYFLWFITRSYGIILVTAIVLAASLELAQLLVEHRSYNINDLVANVLGATAGFGFLVARNGWIRSRKNNETEKSERKNI